MLGLVAAGALPSFLTASLVPEIAQDFALGPATLGIAVGTFYAIASLSSTPAGRLVSRIGTDAAVRLAAGLAAACMLSISLLAQSEASLIALLVVGGLSCGLATPAASAVLTRDVAPHRQGVGYGALAAGAPASSLLAGLALPLVAQPLGWRVAFIAGAAVALLAAPLVDRGMLYRRRSSWPSVSATGMEAAPEKAKSALVDEELGNQWGRWNAVHTLTIAAALASAACTGLIAFLVLFAVDSGFGRAEAGALLAVTGFVAAASRLGLGSLTDRIAERAPFLLIVQLSVASLGFVLLMIGSPALIIVGAVIAGGIGWAWPAVLTFVAVRVGRYAAAEAVGITMSGVFVGALAGPVLVGLVADAIGFNAAWAMGGLLLLGASGAALLAHREEGQRRRRSLV